MNDDKILLNTCPLDEFDKEIKNVVNDTTSRIETNPDNADSALAKLVLTLIELIRKLVEKQAIRRVEGGLLNDDEIERLGETLMKLELKMEDLKKIFDLSDEDLNINLGPLGDLM